MHESSGAAADNRVTIDSGIALAAVSVDLAWAGGKAGLVSRYTDDRNWIMVWYDPEGLFVIALHSDSGFEEVERVKYAWGDTGDTHNIAINDFGDTVDFWVGGDLMYSFDPGDVPESSKAGLFSRGGSANKFRYFTVAEAGVRPAELDAEVEVPVAGPGGVPPEELVPQVVLPPDPALAPLFIEEWRERRKQPVLVGSLAGQGYSIESVIDEVIAHPISIIFEGDILYIAAGELDGLEKGAIYALKMNPDGSFEDPVLMAVGFRRATGLLYAYDSLYVSSRGVITRLKDTDGDLVADETEEIVTGLAFGIFGVKGQATEHQTQRLRLGPDDGRIYVAQGSATDRGPVTQLYEGTIFSMLEDGSDIQVYASGFRNQFDLDFNASGDLFTAGNSANVTIDENPPDELHFVEPGGDHGFPDVLGDPPEGSDVIAPLKTWFPPLAPGGLEFYDGGTLIALSPNDLLLAKWNYL